MKEQKSNWLQLSSIGFQIAAALLLFGWIGYLVDEKFLTDITIPIGLVVGLVVGGLTSLYQIWKIVSK